MDRQSPKYIITGFQQAWNAHDANALAKLFVDYADLVNITGCGGLLRTHPEQPTHSVLPIFRPVHHERWPNRNPHAGYRSCRRPRAVTINGQNTPDGQETQDRRTVMSFVVTRLHDDHGDYWRAVSAHNTDVVPGSPDTHVNSPAGHIAVRYRDER